MSKHTPGPWKIADGFIIGNSESSAHYKQLGQTGFDATQADYNLIATAPELLESLNEMTEAMKAMLNNLLSVSGVIPNATINMTKAILPSKYNGCGVRAQQAIARATDSQ